MRPAPECPRCGGLLQAPGLFSSAWRCDVHGAVEPLAAAQPPSRRCLEALLTHSRVPVWVPDPLPRGWLVAGQRHAGSTPGGASAVVVALSGPSPAGGPADFLIVSEEPGVGVGARYAGLPGPDPAGGPDAPGSGPAAARVHAGGHPTALWSCPSAPADRAVLVGEAKGLWLWVIAFPVSAALLVEDDLTLCDAREWLGEVPFGAASPRLTARG